MKLNALNEHLIVRNSADKSTLGNGIVIQETRGKKDIVKAEVIISPEEYGDVIKQGDTVWYPEFAALPIILDGEHLNVIEYADIILHQEKETE